MDYKKLNFNELGFFCKSTKSNIDFVCLPTLAIKTEVLLEILYYYEISEFSKFDILKLFDILDLKSPRTSKPVRINIEQVESSLNALLQNNVCSYDNQQYYISKTRFEKENYYKNIITLAREKGNINEWEAFANKTGDVCELNSRIKI